MSRVRVSRHGVVVATLVASGAVALFARESMSSDHVDTAEVELSPALDLNDVYVFPGSTDDRIVLVMDVGSPIERMSSPQFDGNAVYQFNIDNTGDAVEDLVIQVLFDDMTDGTQRVNVLGPAAPVQTGMQVRLVSEPVAEGQVGESFTSGTMQVFSGPRLDPFYIDFEQFVRILPDRRPYTFLNDTASLGSATAFRPAPSECGAGNEVTGDAGPFDPDHGCAENLFAGMHTLAVVIELPESALGVPAGADGKIGVWTTIAR